MIKVTLPAPEVAPLRRLEQVPPLEEWAQAAWQWQAMWAPFTLGEVTRRCPRGAETVDYLCDHFNEIGGRCWQMWDQIKRHQTGALPAAMSGLRRHKAEQQIDRVAAQMVAGEWVQIPKEVDFPAWDPHLDCEMFETDGLDYLGRAEMADAVIWAAAKATDPHQQTPVLLTVAELQHALDYRLSRAERHLVFCDAALWAKQEATKTGRTPNRMRDLVEYPVPVY